MKTFKSILCVVIALAMTGCGINTTTYKNDPVSTSIRIDKANFRIVKEVYGYASASYVFGIGGLSKKALEGNALTDMYINAELTGSQQIIDITTTQSRQIILVYMKRKIVAHGYVVEFINDVPGAPSPVSNGAAVVAPVPAPAPVLAPAVAPRHEPKTAQPILRKRPSAKEEKPVEEPEVKNVENEETSTAVVVDSTKWSRYTNTLKSKYLQTGLPKLYDFDGNGEITDEEFERIDKIFKSVDANGSDMLETSEQEAFKVAMSAAH